MTLLRWRICVAEPKLDRAFHWRTHKSLITDGFVVIVDCIDFDKLRPWHPQVTSHNYSPHFDRLHPQIKAGLTGRSWLVQRVETNRRDMVYPCFRILGTRRSVQGHRSLGVRQGT